VVSGAAVTQWAVHVPGADLSGLIEDAEPRRACPPDRAHELLGRRGLLKKEPATRLALCAVHRALKLPVGAPGKGAADPGTAVVASSNLGNAATVHAVARAVRTGGVREVSPLDAPNLSSNIIASTVAIWFGFGGPNVMVCSGATSGLDAVVIAGLLLRARRARRVVVVGAEPGDGMAAELNRRRTLPRATELRAGAACVVLEPVDAAQPRAPVLEPARPGPAPVFVGPARLANGETKVVDLVHLLGDLYGALGVAQVAVGAGLLARPRNENPGPVTIACGDDADGWRSLMLEDRRWVARR
jgi:3-oxoacyl-[acyl-carrier-protein] synthase II